MIDLTDFRNYMIEDEVSSNTIRSYLQGMKLFFSEYDAVNTHNVIVWKTRLKENHSASTVNLRLCAIRKYCEFKDIDIKIKTIKTEKKTSAENVITVRQYNKLINGLKNDNDIRRLIMIETLAKTGARASEAVNIKKKDLLKGSVTLHTKGKERTIYFPKSLIEELTPYLSDSKDNDYIFKNYRGQKITPHILYGTLQLLAKKYNIPKENMHPHAFRHFFAIQFLKRNNNISLLADLLGHTSVDVTITCANAQNFNSII